MFRHDRTRERYHCSWVSDCIKRRLLGPGRPISFGGCDNIRLRGGFDGVDGGPHGGGGGSSCSWAGTSRDGSSWGCGGNNGGWNPKA